MALSYIVPNFTSLNVISQVAHSEGVAVTLILQNSIYAFCYSAVALSPAVIIFENRNLK